MNDTLPLIVILILSLLTLFFCLIWFAVKQRNNFSKLQLKLDELNLLFQNVQQVVEHNRSKITEIDQLKVKRNSDDKENHKNILKNIDGIHQQLSKIKNEVNTLNTQQPEDKLYSRAFKLVELGAGADEISKSCEIPIAEAEMLLAVHQNKVSNK